MENKENYIKNTYEAWCKLKEKIENGNLSVYNDDDKEVEIGVYVSCNTEKLESDILLLQYFFPIADIIREKYKKNSKLIIFLKEYTDDHNAVEMDKRIQHYLYLQSVLRQSVTFEIQYTDSSDRKIVKTKFNQTNFGRVSPIIVITEKKVKYNYKYIFNNISDTCNNIIENEGYKGFYNYLIRVYETEKNKTDKEILNTLFNISENDRIDVIYYKLFMNNIKYIFSKEIKGRQGEKFNDVIKMKIAKELCIFIKNMDIPVLAMYIWSILVKHMFMEGLIIRYDRENSHIITDRLEKAQYDAISYAEGIYQIIENAVIHSEGHCGYLSIRLHNTNRGCGPAALTDVAKRIVMLRKKYTRVKSFKEPFYLEVCFVDNSFNLKSNKNVGMLEKAGKDEFEDLKQLFTRKISDTDDVILHYGLRVFEKTLLLNGGYFRVSSPDSGGYCAFSDNGENVERKVIYKDDEVPEGKDRKKIETQKTFFRGTDYNIIMPVYIDWEAKSEQAGDKSGFMFETESIDEKFTPYIIKLNIPANDFIDSESKKNAIDELYNIFIDKLPKQNGKEYILYIYPESITFRQIEILAKMLYKYSVCENTTGMPKRHLIAICFGNKQYINEFVRMYAVFCDRIGDLYKSDKVIDTQIALCSKSNVRFILCGEKLQSVKQTARLYTYYNSAASLEFVHTVRYLSRTEEDQDKCEIRPIFPFDLYIDVCDDDLKSDESISNYNSRSIIEEDSIWFMQHINKVLNTDMREQGYGCKISDIHISIGTKIHIDSFYNAELLFHNYGNVCRFAYLIAREILREHNTVFQEHERKKICLIGYEEYSSVLLRQVELVLKQVGVEEVEYITFLSAYDETENKNGRFWPDFYEFIKKSQLSQCVFHTILPIATTLTTVYKIQNIMEMICAKMNRSFEEIKFGKSIALVIAGGIKNNKGVILNYWDKVDKTAKMITIKTGRGEQAGGIANFVRYYFNPDCSWYETGKVENEDIFSCNICKEDTKCLIGVDKTSTIPKTIFEMYNNPRTLFVEDNENTKKVNCLLDCVKYSHLCNESNHFQYYIDYEKYCRKEKVLELLQKWLCKNVRPKIEVNAFNIIISPLNKSNSIFLNEVINKAFESNARLLHIEINNSFKENIRTKFNYITEEYNRLKKLRGGGRINVYYVDDCIVSGATMQRGKQFMNMLLMQSEEDAGNVSIYKGAIILNNRSSYETIQNLMNGVSLDNFFYFMRLNVPSYNTHNGICPACDLSEQYQRMHKRSSTYLVADEYMRLKEKYSGKDLEEHRQWIDKNIMESEGYGERFRQRLYYSYLNGDTLSYFNSAGVFRNIVTELNLSANYEKICNEKDSIKKYRTLKDLMADEDGNVSEDVRLRVIDFVKKYVIAERDFMRMKCTHNAFMGLEGIMKESMEYVKSKKITRKKILDTIEEEFERIEKMFSTQDLESAMSPKKDVMQRLDCIMWTKAEWLISYLKIISRKQIAQYYHVRDVMYELLNELAKSILEQKTTSKDIEFLIEPCIIKRGTSINNSFPADIKLRILLTIIRRLSSMHSGFVLKNIDYIYNFYFECKKQYDAIEEYNDYYISTERKELYKRIFGFMDIKTFNYNIAKLTKWSAMSGYDESKCFAVEEKFKNILEKKEFEETQPKRAAKEVAELAFLENTQIIFDGISRIMERFNEKECDIKTHVNNIFGVALMKKGDKKSINKYYPMSTHKFFFSFMDIMGKNMYDKKLEAREELYANMCAYYMELRNLVATDSITDSPYPYVKICNYIRDIIGYQQCRIICEDNDKIYTLVTSDIYREYFDNDIDNNFIEECISKFNDVSMSDGSTKIINDVLRKFKIDKDGSCNETLFIKVPLYDKLSVYIMLYRIAQREVTERESELPIDLIDIWNIRNMLFMRDHFEKALQRDIIALRDMIYSYSYVERITDGSTPSILHISDLHISANKLRIDGEGSEIKTIIEKKDFGDTDLILITGDVIQGSYSAATLEENYEAAADIIRCIAKNVWAVKQEISGSERDFIRSDWKKRILISTGNHDYASMNELEAQNKLRSTTAGVPSTTMGGTMIKYSYFINFLRKFLNIDIDEAIKYDLNFFVNYSEMKLTVVNINSNSRVNPYRTNKVAINETAVEALCGDKKFEDNIVFMMHHTPMYDIDYIDDSYYIDDPEIINEWKEIINKLCRGEVSTEFTCCCWISLIKGVAFDFKEDEGEWKKGLEYNFNLLGRLDRLLLNMVLIVKKNRKDLYLEKKLFDIEAYLKTDFSERAYDDRCQHIQAYMQEKINTSSTDAKRYADCINNIFSMLQEKSDKKYWIIGGHTHRAAYCDHGFENSLMYCKEIIEAGRFIKERQLEYVNFCCGEEKHKLIVSENGAVKKNISEAFKIYSNSCTEDENLS